MKFCRFLPPGVPATSAPIYGEIREAMVREISGAPWGEWRPQDRSWPLSGVILRAPVEPGKVVCVGRNYAAHAAELGNDLPQEPLLFLKPPSAIAGPEEAIVLTRYSQRVEHEAELALVIGKRCSQLRDDQDALGFVLGYTCLNDVTARDLQKKDVQFTRAKGFDTFCPVGPHIETEFDPRNALVEMYVNGAMRQSARTSLMVFPVDFLVRWISRMMTLLPGDVIATGTPAGVGPLAAGDVAEVRIEGLGVLRNPVQAARA